MHWLLFQNRSLIGRGGAPPGVALRVAAFLFFAGGVETFVFGGTSLSSHKVSQQPSAAPVEWAWVGWRPWSVAPRRPCWVAAGRGGEEWDSAGSSGAGGGNEMGRENVWATQAPGEDDWCMDTPRIHYLREMEKLGQEVHDLTGLGSGGAADVQGLVVSTPWAPAQPFQPSSVPFPQVPPGAASEQAKTAREVALQEELRRQVVMAEGCAMNWREEPAFCRPVGHVPGNRKVQQVKLSEDRVMYGSDAGAVGLASALDGRELFRAQAHAALVTALDYDAGTGWMVSAADDGVVKVFREQEREVGGAGGGRVESVGPGMRHHSSRVVAAEVLDHRWGLSASMDGKIVVFELDGGALVQEMWASDTLLAVTVCKNYVFAGLLGGPVEAFSIRNGGRSAFRYIAQRTPVRSLCAYPLAGNHIRVVVGGQDGALRQFQVRAVMSSEGVWRVPQDRAFDDRLVLVCNTHVDPDTREVDQGFVLTGHRGPVVAVACDEEKVVSASEDGSVIVWDAAKSSPRFTVRAHVDGDLVGAVDFNERYLVNDGTQGKVMVWDFAVGHPPRRPGSNGLGAAADVGSLGGRRRRPSAAGPRGSRGQGGGQSRRSRTSSPSPRHDGPPPADSQRGQSGTPPPTEAEDLRPHFPFLGGWNLGHGPTDLEGVGGTGRSGPPSPDATVPTADVEHAEAGTPLSPSAEEGGDKEEGEEGRL